MNSLFELTRRLIDVPSVTGTEAEIGAVLADVLGEAGFAPAFQDVEGARRNVFAVHGSPEVVLCTHMDTVGPPLPSSEVDEFVLGRGACDAKGIAAAMIHAGRDLRSAGVEGFALLFVVGEETVSDGARRSADLGWKSRAVVVGEPTGNVMASGHKGVLTVELAADGVAAHSGYPHLGDSAIDRLIEALVALRQADWGEDPVLGRGSLNVGTIEGGVAANVLAPKASARVSIRVVDSASATQTQLRSILDPFEHVQARVRGSSDPVQCSTLEGWESRPVAFGTDLPYLEHLGQRFLIGPGSIHDAHTDHEKVSKAELVAAVDLYAAIVRTLIDDRGRGGNHAD